MSKMNSMKGGWQLLDCGIQGLLLSVGLISVVRLSLEGNGWDGVFLPLIIMAIPLGAWQVLSAVVKGIAGPSLLHGVYVITALAYCFLLQFGLQLIENFNVLIGGRMPYQVYWILALPPAIGALWYFMQSVRDWEAAKMDEQT